MKVSVQEFDRNDLNNLEKAIKEADWVKGDDYDYIDEGKWINLKKAARPVLETWEKSLNINDDDVKTKETHVETVYVNRYAEELIAQYISKCEAYIEIRESFLRNERRITV